MSELLLKKERRNKMDLVTMLTDYIGIAPNNADVVYLIFGGVVITGIWAIVTLLRGAFR